MVEGKKKEMASDRSSKLDFIVVEVPVLRSLPPSNDHKLPKPPNSTFNLSLSLLVQLLKWRQQHFSGSELSSQDSEDELTSELSPTRLEREEQTRG